MAVIFGGRSALTVCLLTVLVLSSLLWEVADGGKGRRRSGRRRKRGNDKCSTSSVAEYKLTFYGAWSKEKFPRMYPRYRPPAQWSKLVGRSHSPSFHLWTEGWMADPALKRFAEDGDSLLYDSQPQGYHGVFDTFYADPIRGGEGRTSTFLLADGLHSKVSFVVKMVPSPDWFVGVDGLDLCRRGRWRARAHVNLRPIDAGTDRGYTFTSPNWPSHPREPIRQITSSYPDHPASAFLYPEYRRLPRVAYVHVQRVAQYFRKGAVSPLKTNLGSNLAVFEPKTTTTTTTTTTTPTTTTINASEPVYNVSEEIDNSTETVQMMIANATTATAMMTTIAPILRVGDDQKEEIRAAKTSDQEHNTGDSAHSTQLQQRQVPLTSATASTSTSAPASANNRTEAETTEVLVPSGSMQVGGKEGVRLESPQNDIEAFQHDDAMAKDLPEEHTHAWDGGEGGDSLNESSRKPLSVTTSENSETSKEESVLASLVTNTDCGAVGSSPSRSSSARMESSSIQLTSSRHTLPSEATVLLPRQVDPAPRWVDPAPASSPATSTSASNSIKTAASAEAASAGSSSPSRIFSSPPHTSRRTSTHASYEGTPELRSSPAAVNVPTLSSTSASTQANTFTSSAKTLDTTKAVPSLSSPRLSELRADIVGRGQQTRPRSHGRYRVRITPESQEAREWESSKEPTDSQSKLSLEEPQFAQIVESDQFEDDEPQDCRVQEWSQWSACSKTCGFGVRTRSRDVLSHSRNGGFSCPILQQETLCGSMRNCKWKHFSFLSGTKRPRRVRRRRHHQGHYRTHAQRQRYMYK